MEYSELHAPLAGDARPQAQSTRERAWLLVQHYMPIFRWVPLYKVSTNLPRDIVAGLTVGFMAVPQALSYAAVAGLSAQYGLYNAFVGLLPYVVFGTSPHLISGPTAVMSLVTRSAVPATWNGQPVLPMTSDPDDFQFARLTFLLAFLAGLIQIGLGVSGLGFVINLVSQPVIVGFTSAAAFLIVATQFSSLLGVSKCTVSTFGSVNVPSLTKMLVEAQADLSPGVNDPKAAQALVNATLKALPDAQGKCEFYQDVGHVFTHLHEVKGFVLLAGVLCVALLVAFKFALKPALPKHLKVLANTAGLVLLVIMIPIGASIGPQMEAVGIKLVGHIQPGLPGFTNIFENLTFGDTLGLLPSAVTVAALGYMEAMTIAKTVARQQGGYKIDPSQELTALGVCNLVCSQFTGYPVTGSFSRTAVNADSGAASGLASLISAVVVGVACLALTGVLASLPKVVLASIILVAAVNLIEVEEAVFLWRTSTRDFIVFAVVFVLVLVLGVEAALIAGIILHWLFALTLTHSLKNPVAVMGFVSEREARRVGEEGMLVVGEDDATADCSPTPPPLSPQASSGGRRRAAPPLARAMSSTRRLASTPPSPASASPGAVEEGSALPPPALGRALSSGPIAVPRDRRLHLPPPPAGLRLVDLAAPGFAALLANPSADAARSQARICVVPFNADITFNNNEKLRTVVDEALAVFQPRVLVLDCRGVNGVDVSGANALRVSASDAGKRGSSVLVAGLGKEEGAIMERSLQVHAVMHGPQLTRFRCCGVDLPCCGPKPALPEMDDGSSTDGAVESGVALRSPTSPAKAGSVASGGAAAGSCSERDDAAGAPHEHSPAVAAGLAVCIGDVAMFASVGAALRHATVLATSAAAAAASGGSHSAAGAAAAAAAVPDGGNGDVAGAGDKESDYAALGLGKGGIGVPLSPMVLDLRRRAAAKRREQAERGVTEGTVTRWQVSEAAADAVRAVPEGGSPLLQLVPAWEALGGIDDPADEA
ncbi:hypothetical protein FNF31_01830 [Cafeteria roenbergensis]|uniref:STAS domain-containing protein n=1 Tax=Cafeteria roenbergensis TaxID=33653 RepID=A0A5A8DJF3_CAFRO|nr:hypothetical protein FNF28_05964 [Cafeteria roenbergensis]KAA0165482.1 hypothetical protein FNF31_01830 [Cafeteria roenbergensis]